MLNKVIYNNYDNNIRLTLLDNPEISDIEDITKVQLVDGSTTYDSSVLGDGEGYPFDWDSEDDTLILRPGSLGLSVGTHLVTIIVYDDDNTNGVVCETLRLFVRSV